MSEQTKPEDDVDDLILNRIKMTGRATSFIKIIFILIGTLCVSIAQFLQIDEAKGATPAQYFGIFCSIIVFLGGLYISLTESDAAKELSIARNLKIEVNKIKNERRDLINLFNDVERYIQVYQTVKSISKVLESWNIKSGSIADLCQNILEFSNVSLRQVMKFSPGDQGTICIYQAQKNSDNKVVMKLIAHWRELDCDISAARTWEEGVGIAGISYANNKPIIIADLEAGDLNSVVGGNSHSTKDHDIDRYRSMVAIPIEVQGEAKPWGVVTASNNRAGLFSPGVQTGLRTDEGVRALADMIALGVSFKLKYEEKP